MPSLRELQRHFSADLFARRGGDGYIREDGIDSGDRLGFYRNNVFSNYHDALRAVYPVVERLVGEAFFRHAADHYIRLHPSLTGDLNRYGEGFAEFLETFPGASGLAYLSDVARLEWLAEEVFHAAEHPPLDMERLAAVPPEQHPTLTFMLHPACQLFGSRYPVERIWQVNQPDWQGDTAVDLATGGVRLLVGRERYAIVIKTLRPGEFTMLNLLAVDRCFADAYDCATSSEPDFDVAAFLHCHIAAGTLVDFHAAHGPAAAEQEAVLQKL